LMSSGHGSSTCSRAATAGDLTTWLAAQGPDCRRGGGGV
jgi:hypothetical protein